MGNKKLQKLYRAQFQVNAPLASPSLVSAQRHLESGEFADAERILSAYLEANPSSAEGHELQGDVLTRLHRLEDAIESLAMALSLVPGNLRILRKLSGVLLEGVMLPEAVQVLQTITLLDPSDADAHYWLARVLFRIRNSDGEEAIVRSLELNPNRSEAWEIYAQILDKTGRTEQSAEALSRAIELDPHRVDLRTLQIRMLQHAGDLQGAQAAFDNLEPEMRASGSLRLLDALLQPSIPQTVEEIDSSRSRMSEKLTALRQDAPPLADPVVNVALTNFTLTYQGLPEVDLMRQTAATVLACDPSLAYVSPHVRCWVKPSSRIKVGFLSPHFAEHSLGRVLSRFMKELDRRRFEVVLVEFNERYIAAENRVRHFADSYITASKDLGEARKEISELKLDIALFGEAILNPYTDFISYSRFAPVQCMTWGHPATSGKDSIDYWISSEGWDPPGNEKFYSERLIRLGHLPMIAKRTEFAPSEATRADFGVPDGKIYACPQAIFKLHPDFDDLLAAILEKDAAGHLVLSEGTEPRWKAQFLQRIEPKLGSNRSRLHFVPHMKQPEFGAFLRYCDVILDPLHFGGGLSSMDALSIGRPIVTMPIDQLRSRMTAGMYRQMGYEDLIAATPGEYVEIAYRLANDVEFQKEASERILDSVDRIFDTVEACRELEAFFEAAIAGDVGDGYF